MSTATTTATSEREPAGRRRPTLLFGDDGSPAADVAWLWINNHRWPGWRLEVLTARPAEPYQVRPPQHDEPTHWEPPDPRRPFDTAELDEAEQLLAQADPRLALSRSAELLVIGPRGPGLAKALHLGSTAEWLLLHPPSPLVIVRHGRPVRRVVLATDGSPSAQCATDALCRLPWIGQTDVTVLAVDDRRTPVGEVTDRAARQLRAAGATVAESVEAGAATPTILAHLEREPPDLVALGSRGLAGLTRLRLGSTSAAVARVASCSVLVASAEHPDYDHAEPEPAG